MMLFQTPVGLYTTYNEAAEACIRLDMDPQLCILIVEPKNNKLLAKVADNSLN